MFLRQTVKPPAAACIDLTGDVQNYEVFMEASEDVRLFPLLSTDCDNADAFSL